jgi:lysyl endopeptidase
MIVRQAQRTLSLVALSFWAGCASAQDMSPDAIGADVMPAAAVPDPVRHPPALLDSSALVIVLPALSASEATLVARRETSNGRFLLGLGRAIPEAGQPAELAVKLRWHVTDQGGRVAAVRVVSPGALGLRLGVRVVHLPDAAVLRFVAPGTAQVEELSGAAVNASVRRNLASGATGEAAATYWSPLIPGEALPLEIALPADTDHRRVRVTLHRLSHFVQVPFDDAAQESPGAAPCEQQEPACDPEWDYPSRATAMLVHTDEAGDSSVCTGTLLNDSDPSTYVPYLLTAHHCVSEQARASSVQTFWLYRSRRCGGGPDQVQTVPGGADLLYASQLTDTALLRLRKPPPDGVVFSGWSATLPAVGAAVMSVHHPWGRAQRFAVGALSDYRNCADVNYCPDAADSDASHYLETVWSTGVTAPGSSGAGLFLASGQLIGTLNGGFSRCDNPRGPDNYGRFDIPYQDALHRWLGAVQANGSAEAVQRPSTGR